MNSRLSSVRRVREAPDRLKGWGTAPGGAATNVIRLPKH